MCRGYLTLPQLLRSLRTYSLPLKMRITEDKELELISPFLSGGSYWGAEVLPAEEDFKLREVKEWSPPKIELIFITDDNAQQRSGWFQPKEGSLIGQSRLSSYKKETEEKLKGATWSEILVHDFRFREASRLS